MTTRSNVRRLLFGRHPSYQTHPIDSTDPGTRREIGMGMFQRNRTDCHSVLGYLTQSSYQRFPVATGREFSEAGGGGTTAGSAAVFVRPSTLRNAESTSWRMSALSLRNWRAFSRPCPMRSPL